MTDIAKNINPSAATINIFRGEDNIGSLQYRKDYFFSINQDN